MQILEWCRHLDVLRSDVALIASPVHIGVADKASRDSLGPSDLRLDLMCRNAYMCTDMCVHMCMDMHTFRCQARPQDRCAHTPAVFVHRRAPPFFKKNIGAEDSDWSAGRGLAKGRQRGVAVRSLPPHRSIRSLPPHRSITSLPPHRSIRSLPPHRSIPSPFAIGVLRDMRDKKNCAPTDSQGRLTVPVCVRLDAVAERRFCFQYFDACRRRTPRTCVYLKVPTHASHQGLSDPTLRFDLALGIRRRHAPKSC